MNIEKLKELLLSKDFLEGKLSQGDIRRMGVPEETIRYHYYKIYHPERYKKRYGYKVKSYPQL